MFIVLAGVKGGTGKTMLAVAIAAAAAIRGRRVLMLDTDPRRDALTWHRGADGVGPTVLGLSGSTLPDPDTLRGLSFGHDLTVVDTPSADTFTLDRVLGAADQVLIPVGPCPMEIWAIADTLQVARSARQRNPQLRISLLINRYDPRTTLGKALPADLAQLDLPVLRTRIGARSLHAEAMAHGSSACEYAPTSQAASEIDELAQELEHLTHYPSFCARLPC